MAIAPCTDVEEKAEGDHKDWDGVLGSKFLVSGSGWKCDALNAKHANEANHPKADAAASPKGRPSKKWRDLILQVWQADPLCCPVYHQAMRMNGVIDQPPVIEKILRHLNLWSGPAPPPLAARSPPDGYIRVPYDDVDPMPDYENVLTD